MKMNVYFVLNKYYGYEKMLAIPRMFKKINLIGKKYIKIYDKTIKDEREAFKILAKEINAPHKTFKLPTPVVVSKTDSIEKVAEDFYKIIESINNRAKTLDEIIKSKLPYNDYLILCRILEVKFIYSPPILMQYYDSESVDVEKAIVQDIEGYFVNELRFLYKNYPRDISLANIVSAIKKTACFCKYKDEPSIVAMVMDDIREEILYNKKK